MSHLNYSILAFFTNFYPFKTPCLYNTFRHKVMEELIPSIQHTSNFSFENLFDTDEIPEHQDFGQSERVPENEAEMLSTPFSVSAKNPRNCTVPDYSASEILQIIQDAIHYLADYENQAKSGTSNEERRDDVQVFLFSIPLKYRDNWKIVATTQNCDMETLSLGAFKKDLVKEVMLKRSKLVPHLPNGNLEVIVQEY